MISCFALENLNGEILNLVHGTRFAEKQIARMLHRFFNLPTIVKNLDDGIPKTYCQKLLTKGRRVKTNEVIDDGIHVVGKCKLINHTSPQLTEAFYFVIDVIPNTFFFFERVKVGRLIFTSENYRRSKKTSSRCIVYSDNQSAKNIGIIKQFIKIPACLCRNNCNHPANYYVYITKCIRKSALITAAPLYQEVPHVYEYTITAETKIIVPQDIKQMNVSFNVNDKFYIAVPPNILENE